MTPDILIKGDNIYGSASVSLKSDPVLPGLSYVKLRKPLPRLVSDAHLHTPPPPHTHTQVLVHDIP